MMPVLAFLGLGATRVAGIAFAVVLWLATRPGGWAVIAAGALVAVKLLPEHH